MVDVDAILAGARLPERTVPVCLRGDLQVAYEQAEEALAQARRSSGDSLAGGGVAAAERHLETIRQEMVDAVLEVRLRALPRARFTELVAAHPPREDVPGDRALGVDETTLFPELVRVSVVDPVLTDEQWARLQEVITDRQWDALATAAWVLNRGEITVPLSSAASQTPRRTGSG